MSKLAERAVHREISQYVCLHNLGNVSQSTYKTGHSTETAFLNNIHLFLSRGEATAFVLLDLSVVFDTIHHSTLLHVLKQWFGVCGSVLTRFSSYLQDRYQSIKLALSSLMHANSGLDSVSFLC